MEKLFSDHYQELQKVHAEFGAGKIKSVQHADLREAAIVGALQAIAKQMGVNLQTPMRIDSNGEISIVAMHPDGRDPKMGCGAFGVEFAKLLSNHGPRTGTYPARTIDEVNGWCRMNHFSVESLLNEFHQNEVQPELQEPATADKPRH